QYAVRIAEFGRAGDLRGFHLRSRLFELFDRRVIIESRSGDAKVIHSRTPTAGNSQQPDARASSLEPCPVVITRSDRAEELFVESDRFIRLLHVQEQVI